MIRPRIAIPEPSALAPEYSQKSWHRYADAVESAGAEPVRIPLTASPEEMARALSTCEAILLPGDDADVNPSKYGQGPQGSNPSDLPREAADELLLQDAFNLRKPILGICYGFQSMNVWLNGTLIQDLPTQRPSQINHNRINGQLPPPHALAIAENTRLHDLAGSTETVVNSSHHQAVDRLGDGLHVAAIASDGVIEAAEMRGPAFVLGVQWHPERDFQGNPLSRRIFEALVEAAQSWRPLPNKVSGP